MRHFLIISMILLFSAGVLMAETPNWTPITGNQYNMVVFSVVQLNEEDFSNESGNLLGAFGPGGESDCRAIAGYFAGPGVWNMTIGSNVMSGEEISFKIYASEYDTVLDCEETLEFINDATVGSPEEPFELQVEFVFNHPPVIDLPAELTITEDEADQVDFSSYVFDPDGDDLILTCSATMNIDVSISYMIVAFTPAADWNGSETLTFTVYDTESGRLSASDEMMVTVTPVNDPPVIDLPSELIFNEDESLTLEASEYFYDVDGDVLNIAGFGENVSVTVIDGSLIFTAVENWNGTEPVAFFVDDGVSRIITMGEVTVTVTAVNDEPVLLGYDPEWDTSEIIESGTIDFSVTVEDIDSEIEYNWQVNEVGAGNTAEMTYAFDEIGSYMITAGWSDGEFDGSHFWELEVIPDPGEFPRPWDIVYYTNSTVAYCDVTIDGIAAAAEDEVGAFVNGECRGIGYIVLESGAAVSTMNIQGEIPELVEFAVWKASEDMVYVSEFTAMSNPGGDIGYPPDLLPIAVITNYPPVLNLPDELSLDEDTSTTFDFGGYVSDPDGDDLVLTCAHDENLQIDIDGLMVTVTPFANWFGPNTVTFMLSDEQGRLVTEDTMIFMVNPVNDPPFLVAPPTNISFNEDRNKILEFVSGDIEGSAVTITASAGENLMVNQLSPVILVLHSAVSNWYGTSTLNIHLTDEEGGFSDIEIPVTVQPVNDCPTAPSVLPLTTEYNQPLTINLDEYYSDPDGDDLIYTVNSQDHLNFSISNNEALITPAPDYSGVALGSLRGTDPAGLFKLMHIILQIPEPDFPPELHGINPSYTLSEDASKVVTLYAIDDHTPVDELDFEITVMPVHGVAAINPSTRKLTYSPYSNYYGTDQLQIVVTDSGGNVSEAGQYNFVIIRAVNEPPTGQNVEIQLTGDTLFYDLSGDIFDVETPVESLVISSCFNNNDGIPLSLGSVEFTITGTQISYVMPVEENTDYIFYRVTDEDNSSSIPNAIHIVRAGNLPAGERLDPMALNGSFNLEYGQSYEIDFNGLDITEPLEQLTIEIMTAPQYGELTDFGFYEFNAPITTWMGTYTPLTNQDITDEIGFRVSGNNGEAFGTVTINVTAVEIAPDIEEIADFSMLEETSETITINYQNPDEALNPDFWSLSSSPNINSMLSFGELTETTIELIISPAADYTGMALVFVTCTDGSGLSDTEGFVLTVVNVNDAPVINLPDEFSFPEDEEFETSFYGYVSDIDGDALSLNANAADHLQIGIDGMQVTFVPDADWNGTETVTFTVNDNQGRAVASDDVDIVVTAVNDDPSITLPASVTLQEDIAEIIDFTPYLNDIDGDILTITPYGNEYIALDVNGYDVTLTPAADWFGTTDLAFLVDDNQGGNQAFGAMQVIVNAVNDAPEIDLPDNFSFMEDADLTVDFTGFLSDPDSDLLTLSVSGNTEIIVTITDYSVHFSAGADYYGSEILTFNVDDNQGRLIASDQVEVVVTPVNDEPVISGFIPEELDIVIDVETEINFSVAASDVDSEIAYQWFLNSIDLSNPQNYLTLDFTSPGINVIIVNVSDEEYTVSVTWQITFEQPENYDRPWVPVIYTNSTVAYCEVMINGEPAAEDDEVGAFVNYECRGVGYIIQNSGSSYSTMNIQGSTPELVNFAIYDASMDAVLVSEFTTMSSPGGDIGYPPDYLPVYIGELPPVNYARPWVPFIYTNSTVAYCEVMINGEMATEDDEVGAFVDFECRGVGSVVVQRTGSYATLNIQGETPELVNFAVYDASMDEVLISEFTTISNPGGDIGYPPDYLEVYIGEIPQVDYARPWIPVYYTNSTVAYCEVTIDDGAAAADDEVGAFINGECRGIGYIVLDSGTSVSTMNIQGDTPELVEFAVWIASEDMVYVSEFTTMSNPGGDIGYPPDLLPINVITNNPPVLDLPAELVLDEDTAETFDFSGYLSDPDGDDLVLSCVHDGNLQIDIEGFSVTVTPLTNWNGSELVTFQLSDVQDRLIAEDEVLFIVNAVNDLPYLVSPLAISFSEDTYWYQEMTFGDVEGSVVSMTFTAGENLIVTQMTSRVIQLRNAVTNWNGSDTLWVYLTDADGGMTDVTVPVTVLPVNDLPVVSTINLEVEMNQEIVVDLNEYCYDPDGDVLSYAVVTGMLNNLDISIAGSEATLTPFTNYSGLANGYIRAIDPAGLNRRFAVNLEVTAPNYPPEQIITASLFTLKEDTQKIVQLYATDDSTPINQLIFQISAAPAHGVAAINPSTRELTYTPVENYFGTDQLQVIVTDTDGAASAAGIYNFAINAVNDRPVSQNQEILIEGDIFDYDISGDIFDLETPDESLLYLPTITGTGGEPLTVFGLEYTQTGMQLYYEMPAGLNFDYIVYRVVDEGGSQSLPVAIRVYREGFGTGGVRLDPLAINGSFNLDFGQGYEIDFNGLDITEPLEQLTIEITTAPQYGELTGFGFYAFNAPITTWLGTYTPSLNEDITDEIGFRVFGDDGEAFGTITINITAVEIAPDIEEIADYSMLEDTSETITISYQNPDEAVNLDFWSLSSNPNINGMLSFGELTATSIELIINPEADYTGMALVFVTCTDGSGLSDMEGFVLTVVNVNDAPVINLPDELSFPEDEEYETVFYGYVSDIDGDALSLSANAAGHLQIEIDGLLVTFIPDADWNGVETVTFTVNDNQGRAVASDEVDIVVTAVNDDPSIALPASFTMQEDMAEMIDFTPYLTDIDGDILTILPFYNEYIAIDINGYEVTLTPAADWFGTTDLAFLVADNQGGNPAFGAMQVIVNAVNDSPEINLPVSFSFMEDGDLTVDFTTFVSDPDADVLTLSVSGNSNIIADITGYSVHFSALADYYGSEILTFSVDDNQGRLIATDQVEVIVTAVNDEPVISGFAPEDQDMLIDTATEINFSVLASDIDSEIDFQWFLNSVDQNNPYDNLTLNFTMPGIYEIMVNVSDEEYTESITWQVTFSELEDYARPWVPVIYTNSTVAYCEVKINDVPAAIEDEVGAFINYECRGVGNIVTDGMNSYATMNIQGNTPELINFAVYDASMDVVLISEFTAMSNPGGDIGYPPDYLPVYIGEIPHVNYARPWVPVVYTNSTVAYCEVMINGEMATEDDEVGAFVDFECRGVGNVVVQRTGSYATMNIQGESPELVNFAVYDASMDEVLISEFTTMSNPGGDIGYPPDYLTVYIGTIPQGDYARPWVPVIYTNSTVAYCEVMINGEMATEDDEVGAFVDFECRGVGNVVVQRTGSYATMNIQGESPELVNFAVYDASMDEVLISEFTTMSNPGGDIGYPPDYLTVYIGTIPQGDYARPWVPVIYTNSTVAYCEVMINGEMATEDDEVGAFVDFECRGVGNVVVQRTGSYATMNIQGESPELVNFAVYDASMDEVLISEFTTMSNPGGDIGYPPDYLTVYIGTIPQGDYARPWVPVIYTNSTVAYCEVMINGEMATEDDEVGAFVDFECRGVGNVVVQRTGSYATMNIQGESPELVNFAVYDASMDEVLISEFTTMSNPGGDIGYPPDYLTVYIGTIPQGDYARPWVPVIYTNSTVAYCEVMINDEPAAIGDEVGAFVNYECRGVGSVVTDGMNSYATMNIQGESPELVNFAVYVAYMDVVLISDFTTMSNPGGDIGYPPNYLPVYIGTIPQGDYARPWVPVIYTNSTVAYCEVKINDEPAAEDDEVGAFVNFECRGVGYVITDGMNSYATMNIQGESPELVNFAVYDASMDEVLISEFTTMSNPGGDIGYPPNYLPVYIGTIPQGDYARPWVPVIYTNSTVAYCEVMINDESAAIEDEVGAFVNFECRGVGYVITDGMNSYATMNIQGESPELVNFAVYDASMDEVLLSEFTTMSNPGGDIGYPPNYLPVYIGTIPQGDYARPWVPVIYTNSTVAYCEVKIYGEQAAEDDEVGAFVNFECRGTGNVIIERAGSYATLNIQGEMAELVNFAVWDASENEVLISEYTTLSNPGGDIGYPPNFLPVYIGEEIPVDFPRPWDIVIYPNSTIAYCIVTVDGVPAALEDEVGAFAGLECRGIGNIVSNLTASYSTMNIQGDEPELIYFAVWDASSDEVMISEFTAYSSPGGDIGYPPDFLPITVGEALPSEFPRPWVISIYPNSTVAYCQIKINGLPATTNDELGSFVGTECRGIGNIVVSDTGSYSTMNIQGDVPEFVQFAVWDSSSDLVYVSDYTTFTNPGYDIGYPPDFLPIFVGEEVPTDFPRPWNIVIYPNSTVAYCDVTVFGRPASLEDEVGAFVGTECRGIGYISHGNNMASSSINIQGEMPEPVSFAVWISSLDMVLLSEYTTTTNPGGDIGYPPNLLPITVGEELPSIFPRPWEIVIYPNSTVAYCQVKLNDGNCTLEDEVAAFVGEECRGTGEIVFLDGETFTTMNIQGEEPEIVQFALWDSDLEEMYLSDHLAMTAPGSDIGYPPNFLPIYFSTENAVIYPPQINLPESITMQEDGSRILNLANYITGYNYTLSMDAIAELGASLVGRTLIINPADNWNGETTLTIYAQENNATSYDNMQIIVNSVNDAPIIIEPFVNLTLEEDFAGFTIDLDEHFYDVENDQITYSIGFDQSEIYAVLNGSILSINSRLNWFGSTTISISANDNVTRAITQASFLILVTPVNDPPVINLPESYTFAEDGSRTVNLAAYVSDVDGNPLTISMNAGVNITAVINGLNITFHATPDWFGTEIVTINVSDNQSRAIASDEVPVIVTPVNDAPRLLLPIADIQVVEDFIPINIDLYSHFTDVDDPVLDFSYTCNNPNVNITLENGIFTLSSAYNWSGSANISITAADDQYSVTDNFIYQVTAANDGPVITDYQPLDSSLEALAGDIIDFSVTAYDPDSVINYSWLKNGESIASGYNEVSVTFSTVGDYVITAVVTDQEFQITQSWQVTVYLNSDWIPVVYTNSTIAYGRVMINDNNASESDLVGAFIADECRGTGDIFLYGEESYVTMNIQGDDIEEVEFRIFDASTNMIYDQVYSTFTNPGGDIGSPSDPLPIFAYVNQNPAIALPPEGFLFNEDSELVVDLAAYLSDPDDDMLLLTASGLSEVNVALDTYIVTFTAAVNWNGTEHVTFTVDDGNGGSASQTVPVTVIPVNDNPLLILPIADMTMDEDQAAVTIMLDEHFYDVDSDSLVFSAIYQNTALNLSINGNELSFAPKPNWNGITQVTIQASDGFMSVAEDFILTVNPINDLPQLVEVFSDYILAEDFNTFGITLSTHFTDIDGDELFYQIDFDPASINAILAGDIVYINSVENWNGSTAINIAAYDDISNEPATAIINITVNPVNDIPELELPESFEFAEDTIYEVDFAPYIFDVDMDALVLSVMPTVNIDVTIDSLLVTFSAPENYNGMEFITFQVNDNMGRLLATAQTQVIVTAENDQPYVVDDPLSSVEFAEDGQIQFLLTSIFNDPDLVYGDQLSYEVAGANEVIVTFSNNNVTLTAQENWFGQQLLTFTAFDQDNASIFHEVVVTVIPVNDPPYLVMPLPVLLLAEDFDVFTVNISDYFADVEDEMLNYSLEFDDTEFSAELTGTDLDIIQINSVENWFGTAALSVTAADMEMLSFSGEVILQIAPVNDAPVIDLPESISFAEDSNTFLDLSNYVIDVDANELIYTYTGNVSVNVNIEGAILQFSAVPDWYGSEVITITVDDGQGRLTDSDDIQVIVTPVNDPPVLQLPTSISFPEDGSTLLNVALYANDVDGDLLTLSLVNADNIQVSINLMTATISSLPDWNGSENITLAVSDGTAPQVTDIMTVIVTSVNDAPVLSLPASFTFLEDNSLAVNFTPYITDIDSDNFQLSISSGPEVIAVINGLSAVLSASLNWNGTEEIEVTVSDLEGGITSGNTDIIVLPVNDPPYILIPIPDPYVALEDFADVVLDLDDYFADFDGDELSYSAAFNPAHITIEITGSLATISSVPDWNGETTATLTISDGQARAQIIDSFTLQITPVNDAPQLNMPDEFSFNEDGSLAVNVSLYASDVEGDALTLTVTGNTQINVNPIGMTVILSAVPNWYGTETLTFTIDDEQGRLLASDDVTINVLSVNDTPVILSFEPVATELDTLQHSTVHFAVVVDDIDSTPSYEWRLNGVPTGDVDSELDYYFAEAGTFIVRVVITDGEYVLRVTWIVYAEETDNDGFEIIPEITAFCGNYPNPFNPRTTVKFSVDQLQNVKIDVYNAKGQLIRNLANQQFESGYHTIEWNGYDNRSSLQPSGVYFFRMQSLKSQDILKAVMLK